jgi:hypothetical protein
LQSTWGLGNQLFVFPGRKPTLEPGIYDVEINFLLKTGENQWKIAETIYTIFQNGHF